MKLTYMLGIGSVLLVGCGTPSMQAGYTDHETSNVEREGEPSSLFEMSFGPDGNEVTKNLPADAAGRVGDALHAIRSSPPDVTGE